MSNNDLFFTVDSLNRVVRRLLRRDEEKGLLKGEPNKFAVLEKAMVGDTGFEPVTSCVCKKHKRKGKRKI
jgi:hypothetical protein